MDKTKKISKSAPFLQDKGVMLFIFLVSVIVHTAISLSMNMMTINPNEFSMVSVSALLCGKEWSGVMPEITGFHGFIQAVLYMPFMLIFQNPSFQYKMYLILNSVIISLVPVIAYKITLIFNIDKVWQRIVIAFGCGLCTTYIVQSKFIWSEAVCGILPWFLLLLVFSANETAKPSHKVILSLLCAFTTAIAYSANSRLFGMVAAAIILLLLRRIIYKKKALYLGVYFPFLVVFLGIEYFLSALIQNRLNITTQSNFIITNGVSNSVSSVVKLFTDPEGFSRFFSAFFGQLFYFTTSTWGLGILILLTAFITVGSNLYRKAKKKQQIFSDNFAMLGFFVLFYLLFSCVSNAVFCSQDPEFSINQSLSISGFGSNNVVSFGLLFLFIFIFKYGINLRQILGGIIALGILDALAILTCQNTVLSGTKINPIEIESLFPVRIGVNFDSLISADDFYVLISAGFVVMALFIVIISCSKKTAKPKVFLVITGLIAYSGLYSSFVFLPHYTNESKADTAQIEEISEFLYNNTDAPDITVCGTEDNIAMLIQYYNQNSNVTYIASEKDIMVKENTFVVAPVNVVFNYQNSDATLIGRTANYNIYAFGAKSIAYVKSQTQDSQG